MTEYDYSPAAYQRHMETQNRIAKWVDNTEAHHDIFRTPFGPRSDVGDDDLDGMSDADEAIPSGASAGGWYESKRRSGARTGGLPPPPPMLYSPQPMMAPNAMYPAAMASAPVGHYPYPSQVYMSPPASPSTIILQTSSKHHHRSSLIVTTARTNRDLTKDVHSFATGISRSSDVVVLWVHQSQRSTSPGSFYHQPYSAPPSSPYYQGPHSAGYTIIPPNGHVTRVMYV
ncbi:hypothetical protein BDP27DRAFT_1425791 [Rhodocollybia butyracea]|uniref:Uncharacterized protein n=1 Tax=Rhodocollybia butyracea TaxID=206335 RepID=A0A9P5U3E1_9AGAR|nr:hypothetical protein BDP27DRAFT_1425791 [Rhodocollybia butyracea]